MNLTGANALRNVWTTAVEMFFPRRCIACRRLYRMSPEPECGGGKSPKRRDAGQYLEGFLCSRCCSDFRLIGSPLCPCCGVPFSSSQGIDHLCDRCRNHPPAFRSARSAGYYEGGLRIMLHYLKYDGYAQAAAPLGRMLWNACRDSLETRQIDLIIPVPLHRQRLRRRGFNQAEQLVRRWPALAREEGIDLNRERIQGGLLSRRRNTAPQTGLNSKQRTDNVKGAFLVKNPATLRECSILLVDDVMTTGATVDACARALLNGGASLVHVLTLARSV